MDTSYIPTGSYYIREVEYSGVDRVMRRGMSQSGVSRVIVEWLEYIVENRVMVERVSGVIVEQGVRGGVESSPRGWND